MKLYHVLALLFCLAMVGVFASKSSASEFDISFNENVERAGIGVYSVGYRMGFLGNVGKKGTFITSYEGSLLLGSESSEVTADPKNPGSFTNPWAFSTVDKAIGQQLIDANGSYVVLQYVQNRQKGPSTRTEYQIVGVSKIGATVDTECHAKAYDKGGRSNSSSSGRIVKVSLKGTLAKSGEVIFQEGFSGTKFKPMSISEDADLFHCAIRFMKAGQNVRVTYSESSFNTSPIDMETAYDIVSIVPVNTAKVLN